MKKKKVFKRVAAFVATLLVILPLLVVGVAADDYSKVAQVVGDQISYYNGLSFWRYRSGLEANNTSLCLFWDSMLASREDMTGRTFESKNLRNFAEGYSQNVRVGTASWEIHFRYYTVIDEEYGGEWTDHVITSKGTVFYTLTYGKRSEVFLWANDSNDGYVRSVKLVYDCTGVYDIGCTYALSDIIVTYDDLTTTSLYYDAQWTYDGYMDGYLESMYFAFEGTAPLDADYSFSTFFGLSAERNYIHYRECVFSPIDILHYYTPIYDKGVDDGHEAGYFEGYDDGDLIGYDRGYKEGETKGYNKGRQDGESSALNAKGTFSELVIGIFEAPAVLIDSMLDFEIFGLNVAGFVKVLLTLSVTAAIVFFILKITKG